MAKVEKNIILNGNLRNFFSREFWGFGNEIISDVNVKSNVQSERK